MLGLIELKFTLGVLVLGTETRVGCMLFLVVFSSVTNGTKASTLSNIDADYNSVFTFYELISPYMLEELGLQFSIFLSW